jgi:dienelactone hydrolase
MRVLLLACCLVCLARAGAAAGEKSAPEQGTVCFTQAADEDKTPQRYRLQNHTFSYQLAWTTALVGSEADVYHLRFPSPVQSPCQENNTVHAEYYRPRGKGPFPGVIVLDITAGNQDLSRMLSTNLASAKIAALFVQMAYYGPRRPAGSKLRMMSTDIEHSLEAIRQTVLDVRRASAWFAARPEIDPRRLGIHGTSLGSFIGALAAEMEPRLNRVSLLLGGGGIVDAFYDHPQAEPYRKAWEEAGGTKEKLTALLAPVDPLTCAERLKQHRLLMIAGKRDEIVAPKMAEALWQASGRQKIVWYDCTHVGAALYVLPIMEHIVKHFRAD